MGPSRAVRWSQAAFDDDKVMLCRNQPDGWAAEMPVVFWCCALMPTEAEALTELACVIGMRAAGYRGIGG